MEFTGTFDGFILPIIPILFLFSNSPSGRARNMLDSSESTTDACPLAESIAFFRIIGPKPRSAVVRGSFLSRT
jgi:hypothetical protein